MVIEPKVFGDNRGYFMELWNESVFERAGVEARFVQDNLSQSKQGTVRGLHYQIEHAQGKLVKVLQGEVFDVAVDLRRSSSTFGQWHGEILSSENNKMLWVPPGFAHGFYVLSDTAEFFYKCSDFYSPEHERTIFWKDEELAIDWPLLEGVKLSISQKDKNGVAFRDADCYS